MALGGIRYSTQAYLMLNTQLTVFNIHWRFNQFQLNLVTSITIEGELLRTFCLFQFVYRIAKRKKIEKMEAKRQRLESPNTISPKVRRHNVQ